MPQGHAVLLLVAHFVLACSPTGHVVAVASDITSGCDSAISELVQIPCCRTE